MYIFSLQSFVLLVSLLILVSFHHSSIFVPIPSLFLSISSPLFVSDVLNVKLSDDKSFQRMRTGRYVVKTIYCRQCQTNIGWKYLFSEEDGEKYKEGRFVIERTQLEEVPY
ncbi:DEBR0S8_01882g1_1 [Brettanomyces bruxellensis]|uniref:Protein yippee-like n=1 Tax=Dekkera bruxellensis TaxID=5007 RepID=A0A7D9H541_DEKBR|nr:DEBR0S8_01882g1_1 [Brettanomyces bruxellensis]